MKRYVMLLALLLLVGCQAGSALHDPPQEQSAPALKLGLRLTAEQSGGDWRVLLTAPNASDLYQIAGTLRYDPARYDVLGVEAGGGLGGFEDCYFLSGEPVPGSIAFAYTKRRHGAGAGGDVTLLAVRVSPRGAFRVADFELDSAPGALVARDSAKRNFDIAVAGEVR